jgi:membrane protein implicated in regulation of membrane protease activity
MAVVTGGGMLAVIIGAALVPVSRALLLAAFAAYVAAIIFERVSYANSVLAYKSLIRKLLPHVNIDRPDEDAT